MRRNWLRDFDAHLYWLTQDLFRRWRLDTPAGFAGIIALISGVACLIILGQGFARMFQVFFPWVAGNRVGEVYWRSVGLGFRASFSFLVFCISFIIFLTIKFTNRR